MAYETNYEQDVWLYGEDKPRKMRLHASEQPDVNGVYLMHAGHLVKIEILESRVLTLTLNWRWIKFHVQVALASSPRVRLTFGDDTQHILKRSTKVRYASTFVAGKKVRYVVIEDKPTVSIGKRPAFMLDDDGAVITIPCARKLTWEEILDVLAGDAGIQPALRYVAPQGFEPDRRPAYCGEVVYPYWGPDEKRTGILDPTARERRLFTSFAKPSERDWDED